MKTVTKLLLLTVALSQVFALSELRDSVFGLAKDEITPKGEDLLQKAIDEYHLHLSEELPPLYRI